MSEPTKVTEASSPANRPVLGFTTWAPRS
jgi:hypothetical protein